MSLVIFTGDFFCFNSCFAYIYSMEIIRLIPLIGFLFFCLQIGIRSFVLQRKGTRLSAREKHSSKGITAVFLTAFFLVFLKPLRCGSLLCSGICPPSKPGLVLPPDRESCPLVPLPLVVPCPEPFPLPTLFLFFIDLGDPKSPSFTIFSFQCNPNHCDWLTSDSGLFLVTT